MLQFFNNFDTFSAEFDLLFIFDFAPHNPPDFTEQLLGFIYRVDNVVRKVLILTFWFKLYLHGLSGNNERIPFQVMPIF